MSINEKCNQQNKSVRSRCYLKATTKPTTSCDFSSKLNSQNKSGALSRRDKDLTNSIENRKRKREMEENIPTGNRVWDKKVNGEDYIEDCACAYNLYQCKYQSYGCNFKGAPNELDLHQIDLKAHEDLITKRKQNDSDMVKQIEKNCKKYSLKMKEKLMDEVIRAISEGDGEGLQMRKKQMEKLNMDINREKEELNIQKQDLNKEKEALDAQKEMLQNLRHEIYTTQRNMETLEMQKQTIDKMREELCTKKALDDARKELQKEFKQELDKKRNKELLDSQEQNSNKSNTKAKLMKFEGKRDPKILYPGSLAAIYSNSYLYTFTWKLSHFTELLDKHENGTHEKSNPFYMGNFGHKMQLELYPNGFGYGCDTSLSFLLRILDGEWDGILDIPRCLVDLTLLDQGKGERYWWRMSVVDSELTKGWKYETYCSPIDLIEPPYLVNDTIYLKVRVELFD